MCALNLSYQADQIGTGNGGDHLVRRPPLACLSPIQHSAAYTARAPQRQVMTCPPLPPQDIIHTSLSVREGLELVVSVGMALPPTLVATKVSKALQEALMAGGPGSAGGPSSFPSR